MSRIETDSLGQIEVPDDAAIADLGKQADHPGCGHDGHQAREAGERGAGARRKERRDDAAGERHEDQDAQAHRARL